MIIDHCLAAKDINLMFTMLFTTLFVEENRPLETKHSLVDAQTTGCLKQAKRGVYI